MAVGEESVRCFAALPVGEAVRRATAAVVDGLRGLPGRVAWVPPENLHLTLRFLGDVAGGDVPAVARALDRVALAARPFTLRYGGLGAFPPAGAPRVLWVGVSGAVARAQTLYGALEVELGALGMPREERPWVPHLTVGRVRALLRPGEWAAACSRSAADDLGADLVDRVVLLRSYLEPGQPPRYEPLHETALRAAADGGAP